MAPNPLDAPVITAKGASFRMMKTSLVSIVAMRCRENYPKSHIRASAAAARGEPSKGPGTARDGSAEQTNSGRDSGGNGVDCWLGFGEAGTNVIEE
jgi:hypothetical protein